MQSAKQAEAFFKEAAKFGDLFEGGLDQDLNGGGVYKFACGDCYYGEMFEGRMHGIIRFCGVDVQDRFQEWEPIISAMATSMRETSRRACSTATVFTQARMETCTQGNLKTEKDTAKGKFIFTMVISRIFQFFHVDSIKVTNSGANFTTICAKGTERMRMQRGPRSLGTIEMEYGVARAA